MVENILNLVNECFPSSTLKILVGNKQDLANPPKLEVDPFEVERICQKWKLDHIQSSALTRTNVDEVTVFNHRYLAE